jgi:hypothetical protein
MALALPSSIAPIQLFTCAHRKSHVCFWISWRRNHKRDHKVSKGGESGPKRGPILGARRRAASPTGQKKTSLSANRVRRAKINAAAATLRQSSGNGGAWTQFAITTKLFHDSVVRRILRNCEKVNHFVNRRSAHSLTGGLFAGRKMQHFRRCSARIGSLVSSTVSSEIRTSQSNASFYSSNLIASKWRKPEDLGQSMILVQDGCEINELPVIVRKVCYNFNLCKVM